MAAGHLSPSVEQAGAVYVSGQLPIAADGSISGDIEAQTRQTVANLKQVLAKHGLGLDDIIKTTVFIVHPSDFPIFNSVYAELFGDHKPARSTVVAGLVAPSALVEIDAIASKPGR